MAERIGVFKDVDLEVRWTNEMWKGVMEAHGEARPEATTHTHTV